jgi:hypothetical protein
LALPAPPAQRALLVLPVRDLQTATKLTAVIFLLVEYLRKQQQKFSLNAVPRQR